MTVRWLVSLALIAACSKSADPQPEKDKPVPAVAQPEAKPVDHAELVKFCAQCYFKMMDCFKDEQFWQTLSTMYFANTNLSTDTVEKEHWVGLMKEDLLKLYNAKEFEKNCEATLEHNKAPTARQVQVVSEARAKSCSAFASAFGYMVFNEGALHQPK